MNGANRRRVKGTGKKVTRLDAQSHLVGNARGLELVKI